MPRWPAKPHPTPAEAAQIQQRMREQVVTENAFGTLKTVAGVDAAIGRDSVAAAIAVLAFPDLSLVRAVTALRPVEFPYVPGLLAFREIPAIRDAFSKLAEPPGLVLVDGHGRAHPRRFGIACMLGVELDVPTIGIGKSRLAGTHDEPASRRGSHAPLTDAGELIGYALRTRDDVRAIYVSIGHRVDLDTAARLTLECCRFRLPEPIRRADTLAGEAKANASATPTQRRRSK